MITLHGRMGDIPVGLKPRMRELSLGPWEPWGFHPWTFHDGSTWASLAFAGATVKAEQLIGWAGLTMQIDTIPVLGVFVDEGHRGGGRAELLVTGLLRELLAAGHLQKRDRVAASTQRWSKYPDIIKGCGLRCMTWGGTEK